jgi:class 3 adenylate cyclase
VNALRAWAHIAADPLILRRGLVTSLVVGSLLTVINHGDRLAAGSADPDLAWRIGLTFLVPFIVSTLSGVAAIRAQRSDPSETLQLLEREVEAINKFPDQNPNPVLRLARDGQLLYANAASEPITSALGIAVGTVVPDAVRDELWSAAEARPPRSVEVASGWRTFSVLAVGVPELDVLNLYGTDITGAKVVERFPDSNPNPVLRTSEDDRLIYANTASQPLIQGLDIGLGERLPAGLHGQVRAALAQAAPEPIEVHAADRTFALTPVAIPEFSFTNIYGTDVTAARQVEQANRENERLLLNILPASIADRLRQGEMLIADRFEEMTVLFADVVDFTQLSVRMTPAEVVAILNRVFSIFDGLADRYGLEKIKTIGDAYMVVGGLSPGPDHHVERVADMGLDMIAEIGALEIGNGQRLEIRVGMQTGPAVAGVIGLKKFIYDVWGDTVNTASRMESHGIPGRIHVTEATYQHLRNAYAFESRGTIDVRGKGPMSTYLLLGRRDGPAPVIGHDLGTPAPHPA